MSDGGSACWSLDEGEGGDDAQDLGIARSQHLVWYVCIWCGMLQHLLLGEGAQPALEAYGA